jgi:large subunit ribosomal protein L18e
LKTGKTNPIIGETVEALRALSYEEEAPIWKDIAKRLSKGTRRMPGVNVGRIGRSTSAKDQVLVPGKVLGSGDLEHAVTVAGMGFSARAAEKITKAGGECIDVMELTRRNPKGSNVKIMI